MAGFTLVAAFFTAGVPHAAFAQAAAGCAVTTTPTGNPFDPIAVTPCPSDPSTTQSASCNAWTVGPTGVASIGNDNDTSASTGGSAGCANSNATSSNNNSGGNGGGARGGDGGTGQTSNGGDATGGSGGNVTQTSSAKSAAKANGGKSKAKTKKRSRH